MNLNTRAGRDEQLRVFVINRVEHLYNASRHGGEAAGVMAGLRRQSAPGSNPKTWAATLDLPAELTGRSETASTYETAAHAALSLWATHQQSKPNRVHQKGVSFGSALRRLAQQPGVSQQSVERRVRATVSARSLAGAAIHARGLIRQLREHGISLDYGALVSNLEELQSPAGRNRVALVWGRDLHRATPKSTSTSNTDLTESD